MEKKDVLYDRLGFSYEKRTPNLYRLKLNRHDYKLIEKLK